MRLPILQLSCRFFFFGGGGAKHHITQVCQPPYSPDLAPCNFWLFQKLKSPLKIWRFVNECRHGLVPLRLHSFATYKNIRSGITSDNLKRSLGVSNQFSSSATSLSTITSCFQVFIFDKPSTSVVLIKIGADDWAVKVLHPL